jgi:glycerophosphoryl diester phosphodiesterase
MNMVNAPLISYIVKRFLLCCLILAWTGLSVSSQPPRAAEAKPLIHAHAHNDYEHARPLLDALDHGFCSIEADIYLVDGQLLVAHDRAKVRPERTLQSLYLEPLRQRVKANGGRVYRDGPECVLLIDIKSDWQTLYPVLRETLKQYADIFTTFRPDTKQVRAVTAILTGNRAKEMFAGESVRYAAFDGELEALDSDDSADLIPWVSSNWAKSFQWRGVGVMPQDEQRTLQTMVAKAHHRGRRIRFWGTPDQTVFWKAMLANGVDLINSDDLPGVQEFFTTHH